MTYTKHMPRKATDNEMVRTWLREAGYSIKRETPVIDPWRGGWYAVTAPDGSDIGATDDLQDATRMGWEHYKARAALAKVS